MGMEGFPRNEGKSFSSEPVAPQIRDFIKKFLDNERAGERVRMVDESRQKSDALNYPDMRLEDEGRIRNIETAHVMAMAGDQMETRAIEGDKNALFEAHEIENIARIIHENPNYRFADGTTPTKEHILGIRESLNRLDKILSVCFDIQHIIDVGSSDMEFDDLFDKNALLSVKRYDGSDEKKVKMRKSV